TIGDAEKAANMTAIDPATSVVFQNMAEPPRLLDRRPAARKARVPAGIITAGWRHRVKQWVAKRVPRTGGGRCPMQSGLPLILRGKFRTPADDQAANLVGDPSIACLPTGRRWRLVTIRS